MRPEVLFRFLPRSPGKHKQAKKQTSGAQGREEGNTAVKCLRMRTESALHAIHEYIHPAKMLEVFCNL